MKRGIIFASLALILAAGGYLIHRSRSASPKSLVLITWGGAERNRVRAMMDHGELPALSSLERQGSYVSLDVMEGKPYSKAGLAQILTGYNSFQSRVLGRARYAPIPEGWTLFERLKSRLGGIRTVLLSGHPRDLGARGPHSVCANCAEWDPVTGLETNWWDPAQNPVPPEGLRPEIDQMPGDPLFNARPKIDFYEAQTLSTDELCTASLDQLDQLKGSAYFAFLHFPGANIAGHRFGESSPEYAQALREEDACLGKIRKRLAELDRNNVRVMVTTENGMDPGTKTTLEAFRSFLVTDIRGLNKTGDRRDLAPTVLDYFGIDPAKVDPPLPGHSLSTPNSAIATAEAAHPIRIGYFLGGRTAILYRALLEDAYEREGLNVELMTKRLYDKKYVPMEKTYGRYNHYFGKASGTELVEGLLKGDFDFATIGETALILAAQAGQPIVAVAELGHDSKEHPGHGIILKHGLRIKTPEDFKHLRLVARRSSGGDLVMLREFLLSKGLDPDRDVTILSNLKEDKVLKRIGQDIDGGYYHLGTIRPLVRSGRAYLYQPLNWVDPHLSFAILVTSRKFAQEHPDQVEKVIRAYMKYNRTELALPEKERRKIDLAGIAKEVDFEGLNFPQSEPEPLIRLDLLNLMQSLLVKHGLSDSKVDLAPWVDNHFVKKVAAELGHSE